MLGRRCTFVVGGRGGQMHSYSHPETGDASVLSESAELLGQLRAPLSSGLPSSRIGEVSE
jgi:hypothetical protein